MMSSPSSTWYKDAIIYEVHVRAFYDSVTDGIGDFAGLTQKLDYLADLGVTAVWLLPFYPSPLRDDGYDISNYTDVNKQYGTLRDFQRFLREAHRRGLRVIIELVLNHTSDQHLWFQRSRRAEPGTPWRNFYVWSDTPDKYSDARIIFKDFETSNWTWDPVAKAYYWHRFYSHQPDLNWDNPEVRESMFAAMDFWFDLGVDGLRLDAVPYLFEREGTNCENLPETHAALRELRKHVDDRYRDCMLLAEANQWPEDAVAYFGKGDECHMAFHFPLMPRLFMSLRMEDRYPVTDILRLTPNIPENCQWAMFLRNHDELTLEMVTDEERDYMYRTYAHDREARINLGIRRRLAPLLENDRRKIELMLALLLSLPGTPVLYYGDEIGMGDNIYLGDRNGVRTPMQWSADRNAGFSRANPQKLYLPVNIDPEYHYETVNVEAQLNNPHSLLWWMKRVIAQRKQFRCFGRGGLEFLYPSNRKVLAFIREYEDEKVLVLANLSRFSQYVELDLSKHQGLVPVEVFGHTRFPSVSDQPYLLTMGPYAYYYFHLQTREQHSELLTVTPDEKDLPVVVLEDEQEVFTGAMLRNLERIVSERLQARLWFQGKGRTVRQVRVTEVIPLKYGSSYMLFVSVDYGDADSELYSIPLSMARGEATEPLLRDHRDKILARLEGPSNEPTILYAGSLDRDFADSVLRGIVHRRRFRGRGGELVASRTHAFRRAWKMVRSSLEPHAEPASGQPTTMISIGEDFVLKVYRRLEEGINPDREIEEFLTEQTEYTHVPRALGSLEYVGAVNDDSPPPRTTVGLLTSYVRNSTDGWMFTLDHLGLFFERALAISREDPRFRALGPSEPFSLAGEPLPPIMGELLGNYTERARQVGEHLGNLHIALCSHPELPDFAPEPFTEFYRHSLYHGMLARFNRTLDNLRSNLMRLPDAARADSRLLLEREEDLRASLVPLRDTKIGGARIRHHGNFHLGQLLFTGTDVMITNFEGDISRPMSERRLKRTGIRDVAAMVRSFHYASHAVLYGHVPGIIAGRQSSPGLETWAQQWYQWVSAVFLEGYFSATRGASFLPAEAKEREIIFQAYLLEKALLEMDFELANRNDWIRIPVRGVLEQLNEEARLGQRAG